jgi:hypothetical protein
MFDTATSTLEYRPAFGRRVAPPSARDAIAGGDRARSVDAITAELRQRVLAVRKLALLPVDLRLALAS